MTYKDSIISDMRWLGKQKYIILLGQGIAVGDRMYHTLDTIPQRKCIGYRVSPDRIQAGSCVSTYGLHAHCC